MSNISELKSKRSSRCSRSKKELLTKHPVNRPQITTLLLCLMLTSSACPLLKCVNLLLPVFFFFNILPIALPPLALAHINTHKARIRSQMHRLKQTCLRCEAVNNHPGWSRHSAAVTFQRGFAKKNPTHRDAPLPEAYLLHDTLTAR